MIHAYLIGGPSDLTKVALSDDSPPHYYQVAETRALRASAGPASRAELMVFTHSYRLAYTATREHEEPSEVAVYMYHGAHRHA